MRRYFHALSLFVLIVSSAVAVKVLQVKPVFEENPLCALITMLVSLTVYLLSEDDNGR